MKIYLKTFNVVNGQKILNWTQILQEFLGKLVCQYGVIAKRSQIQIRLCLSNLFNPMCRWSSLNPCIGCVSGLCAWAAVSVHYIHDWA